MLRKQLSTLGFAVALGLTVPAWSADAPSDTGWFAEASAVNTRSSGGETPYTFRGDELGMAIGGGYRFTKHLALEGKLYNFGEHVATGCPAPLCTAAPQEFETDLFALSFAAVGTWRVAPSIEVFGKLGVLGSVAEFRNRLLPDETERAPLIGAGVGILITPQWRLNVQVERAADELELETAGIGASFRF